MLWQLLNFCYDERSPENLYIVLCSVVCQISLILAVPVFFHMHVFVPSSRLQGCFEAIQLKYVSPNSLFLPVRIFVLSEMRMFQTLNPGECHFNDCFNILFLHQLKTVILSVSTKRFIIDLFSVAG